MWDKDVFNIVHDFLRIFCDIRKKKNWKKILTGFGPEKLK